MDVFFERIVKKQPSAKETTLKIIVSVLALAILAAALFFMPLMGPFGGFGVIIAVAIIYGAYRFVTSLDVEYEALFTNGELDIDKIIARRSRKRLITAQIKSFEVFAKYDKSKISGMNFDTTVQACSSEQAEDTYYAIFTHNNMGKTLLLFNPDERMIEAMKQFLPITVRSSL